MPLDQQLTVLTRINTSLAAGEVLEAIAARTAVDSDQPAHQDAWWRACAALAAGKCFATAMIRTRLLSPEVETVLGVYRNAHRALAAAIAYLQLHAQRHTTACPA